MVFPEEEASQHQINLVRSKRATCAAVGEIAVYRRLWLWVLTFDNYGVLIVERGVACEEDLTPEHSAARAGENMYESVEQQSPWWYPMAMDLVVKR